MKKLILSVAFAAMALGGFAQEYGAKAGLVLANITNDTELNMKPSFYLGGFYTFKINDFWSVQPELIYSRQGGMNNEGGSKFYVQLHYLNIPILAKIDLIDNLTLEIGPQIGFLLSGRWREKVDGSTSSGTLSSIGAKTHAVDVSAAMGLTYRFTYHVEASARYNLGLTNIFKDNPNNSKNSVLQIGVGYRF